MDREEFNQWAKDYGTRFPSIRQWWAKMNAAERPEVLELWAGVLSSVPLWAALEVNRQIYEGEIEGPGSFDNQRERTPVYVRDQARQVEKRRRALAAVKGVEVFGDPERDTPRAGIMERYREAIAAGKSHLEAAAEAIAAIPIRGRQEAFRCLLCRDTGLVDVWSERAIQETLNGDPKKNAAALTLCVAACKCERGEAQVWREPRDPPRGSVPFKPSQQYDERYHAICRRPWCRTAAEELAELRRWIVDALERRNAEETQRLEKQAANGWAGNWNGGAL